MNHGFHYIWLAGKNPCHVTPDLKIIPFDVIGDVPYLLEDGLHTYVRDPEQIAALTGVMITPDGKLVIDPNYLSQFFDAAAGESVAGPSLGADREKGGRKVEEKGVTCAGLGTDGESTEAPSGDEFESGPDDDDTDPEERAGRTVRQSLAQRACQID